MMNGYSDICELGGVGAKTASLLHKLGIYNIWDLISYYPRDYEQIGMVAKVIECPQYYKNDEIISLRLKIKSTPVLRYVKNFKILSCVAYDDTGMVELTWFNMPYLKNTLKINSEFVFTGRLKVKGASYQLSQPKIMNLQDFENVSQTMQPLYALTKGITAAAIRKYVKKALSELTDSYDYLEKINKYNFMEMYEAINTMHFPKNMDEVLQARKRLVFDEFFFFIMNVRQLKDNNVRQKNNFKIKAVKETDIILDNLPYKLTNAQRRTFNEIIEDIGSDFVMNRLVQGDVGSGKTIVAILTLITACKNGYQCAMMAPTEVLVRQHYEEICNLLHENNLSDIKCVLLTGSMTAKAKRENKELIKNGEASIVIGTHAVIQEDVIFDRLGLVITDEQHRFGVKQREKLSRGNEPQKESSVHTLVMSATPIPRTLAIILYGDLDISIIDELPANRLPIKNCVVGKGYRAKAYSFIEAQIREGRQALVVCPMVTESEALEAENVIDYTNQLKENMPEDINIDYLHGKLKSSEKNAIMERFASGQIQILVSTTVIEVGINVPNTTVMLVENAERFGLSQLHQLRGRVGRGKYQSYCIFMCGTDKKDSLKRLDILNKSNDGFMIAREDLRQRGPGDVFGFRQSGDMNFKIGDIYTDADILKQASEFADYIYENNIDESTEGYEGLFERLNVYSRNMTI